MNLGFGGHNSPSSSGLLKRGFVVDYLCAFVSVVRVFFHSRTAIALEVVALRQQKRPKPPLSSIGRLFWIALSRFWSGWKNALLIVKPETVLSWHRKSFQWYWR